MVKGNKKLQSNPVLCSLAKYFFFKKCQNQLKSVNTHKRNFLSVKNSNKKFSKNQQKSQNKNVK